MWSLSNILNKILSKILISGKKKEGRQANFDVPHYLQINFFYHTAFFAIGCPIQIISIFQRA